MDTGSMSLILAGMFVTAVAIYVLFSSSRKNKMVWQPAELEERVKISPSRLAEEAHTWYVAAKQETDLIQALIRTSYGIACLRSIQNSVHLSEVKGATLPPAVHGPAGLMAKLSSQQAVLLHALGDQKRAQVSREYGTTRTTDEPELRDPKNSYSQQDIYLSHAKHLD